MELTYQEKIIMYIVIGSLSDEKILKIIKDEFSVDETYKKIAGDYILNKGSFEIFKKIHNDLELNIKA